jgi:signal transduction histidine kinase
MKGAMVHLQQKWKHEPQIQEITRLVTEEIDRLDRVVAEFLYFSKQAPPRLEPMEVNRVILGAQALLVHEALSKGITFHNRLDADLPLVSLDAHQMEQVLLNLIINAMDALGENGEIGFTSVMTEKDGAREVWVEVEDHGEGISPENLPNVFDPFFTTKEDGTGLGLPLSLGIVEGHGGVLELESDAGEGTRARIRLPLSGLAE